MTAQDDMPVARRAALPKAIVVTVLAFLVVIALAVAGLRFGVLLPQGRLLIEAAADGLKIGRFGRLKIEGLSGDVWRDLSIRRLTIRDEGGVWLEADNLHMTWRYIALLGRSFHADRIEAQTIKVLRRPTLTKKGEDTGNPVSFRIDQAHARIEMLPAFSYVRGVYDVDLNKLYVGRTGGQRGQVRAASVLHPGDHLNVDFDVTHNHALMLLADAKEAQGGALAGALGLPADQAFTLQASAGGKISAGHFTAEANSGAIQPLKAKGAWTEAGGEASGRVSLTASTLTAPYARRFGPSASFVLVGRRAGPDLFALEARVASENLAVRAHGLGNLGQRRVGPKGIEVAAETQALSRITGGPDMGPSRVVGTLSEAKPGWRFAGNGSVSRASLGGYSLGQASGPLEVTARAGQWDIKTKLAGAGGRGTGLVGAALGAAPRATFDGARLADGRLLLRELQVVGAGLKVDATGGRSLIGGLTFKGNATVSNLAAARPGAAGSAQASWSAGQAKAGQPWRFQVDARGDRFATSYPELDRLLGPRPQFQGQADLQGRRLSVGSATLTGAAMRVATAGVLAPDGGLSFKLDWNADGPFHAGPVEVTGRARGSGAITGALSAPRADLLADVAAIDVPRLPLKDAHVTLSFLRAPSGSSGMVAVTATSAYGPARARSDFRFPEGGVDLTALSVDAGGVKADGSLSLRRSTPSAANLEVVVTRGAFLDAGRVAGSVKIADSAAGGRAALNLTAADVRFSGSTITVHAAKFVGDGPLDHLAYSAQADGQSEAGHWGLNGSGQLSSTKPGYAATFSGQGRLGRREVHTLEAAQVKIAGPDRSARLRLASSDGGRIDFDGRLSEAGTDVRAQVTGLTLGMVNEDLVGHTDATLTLQGSGARLDGSLLAKVAGARGRGTPTASGVDGEVHGRLAGNLLTLDMTATNALGLSANASVALPAESSAAPFRVAIARQQPMRGKFLAQGEVRPLWDLLVGGERSLAGKVMAQGTVGGTLASPNATGQITVAGGRFDDGGTGLSLRDVALTADFNQTAVSVTQASGVDGHGGSVSGSGKISLEREGASTLRLDLKGFRLIDNGLATASATGAATIDRAADGKVRISGKLAIDHANVAARLPTPSGVVSMAVIEKNRPADLPDSLAPPAPRGEGWALDVTLQAAQGIFLRGHGLDVELSLDAHVGGTTNHPNLTGTAHVVRGGYDFAGRRFEFDPRSVVYLSTRPESIRLDLTATRDDPSLTASVNIRGTAARPEISLSSTPSLPNDEVLAQVLFGRSASQLSPLEAAQLASALSSLAGGGGFDVIGNLRTFAGLDRLTLGGGNSSGMTVSGGKYLTNNVYLELTGGGRDGGAAQVEWRARRSISIISRVGAQGDSRLAIRWRRDY